MRARWDIADCVGLLWYKRRLFGSVALALFALAAAATWLIPSRYTATATLLLEQPTINVDPDMSASEPRTAAEIHATRARIMTMANLKSIVKQNFPDAGEASEEDLTLSAAKLKDQISVQVNNVDIIDQKTGHPGEATIGFAIGYTNTSPDTAYGVVDDVVRMFLKESAGRRTSGVSEAVALLDGESRQLEAQVERLDGELAKFKQANAQSLPDGTELKLTQLERFNRELADLQSRVRDLESRKGMRQADLAMLSPTSGIYSEDGTRLYSPQEQLLLLQAEYAAKAARYSPQHPDLVKLDREIKGLQRYVDGKRASGKAKKESRLTAEEWKTLSAGNTVRHETHTVERGDNLWVLSRRYAVSVEELVKANGMPSSGDTLHLGQKLVIPVKTAASGVYTDAHPDVMRVSRKMVSDDSDPGSAGTGETPVSPGLGDNPSYLRTRAELNSIERELTLNYGREKELRGLIAQYEKDLSRVPEVERRLNELMRKYDTVTAQLARIKEKQLDAALAKAVDTGDAGSRFSLAEPIALPSRPDQPNRKVLLFFSLILALAGSAGAVLATELRRSIIYDARGLRSAMNIRPLGSIPEMSADSGKHRWLPWPRIRAAV